MEPASPTTDAPPSDAEVQARRILAHVADGIAVVDFDLRVRWANPIFRHWVGSDPVGRGVYEALGASADDYCPFQSALVLRSTAPSAEDGLACTSGTVKAGPRTLELRVTPLDDTGGSPRFVAMFHDVSATVARQRKLDALHRAGATLASVDAEKFLATPPEERVELLKANIRRLTRDLLHYEVLEIRVLDPQTSRLSLLLQEGIPPQNNHKDLVASTEGNGVTGFVAVTGRSYLCPDTRVDPHYLAGGEGARSSLTVPLRLEDRVVGTLNVESPAAGAFGEEDLQFAEIFSHAVAAALNTLDLLETESKAGAGRSIDAVSREVALPVDDILNDAVRLLDEFVGHTPEAEARIRNILANARLIKQSIAQVGDSLGSPVAPSAVREAPPPALKGVRVLVADNDDKVRRSAHQLIGRWGGIVETARDGREAVAMARLAPYDVIVADIRLPDMAGYEVYQALRLAKPAARVVLMTGYGYDAGHSLVKARADGLKHVLFKPFRADQLRTALTDLEGR